MEDFIVRIYRFEKDNPKSLVGLVEKVGRSGRKGFTNLDELWEILNLSMAGKAHFLDQKYREKPEDKRRASAARARAGGKGFRLRKEKG